MRTATKAILITIVSLMAVVLVALCGTLFWINSTTGRQWLQSRIDAAIPGSLAIDAYHVSLLRPSLELHGVILKNAQGRPVAGFDLLAAELDWWPLLAREIRLARFRLQTPWADLAVDSSGRLNLIDALTPSDQGSKHQPPDRNRSEWPVNIVCRSFELIDGRLSFSPEKNHTPLTVDGISLQASGDLYQRQAGLDLEVGSLRYQTPDFHPPPIRIVAQARLNGDRLQLPVIEATSGSASARLEGMIRSLTTSPEVDARLTLHGRLPEIKEMFTLAGDFDGVIDTTLSLNGALANPSAALGLSVDDGRIAGLPLDHLRLSVKLKDRQATIADSAWHLADGVATLDGEVDLQAVFPTGFLDPPTDLNAVTYAISLAPSIPQLKPWLHPWFDITGALNGRLAIDGTGVAPSQMSTKITLDAMGQNLLTSGMKRSSDAALNFSAQLENGQAVVHRLHAATDGLTLSGTAAVGLEKRSIDAALSATAPDLANALAVVGIAWVDGTADASLDVRGSFDRPQFTLSLAAGDLKLDTYTIGNLRLDAAMDHEGRLNLGTLDLKNGNSHIKGSARLRLLAGGTIDPEFDTVADLQFVTLSLSDFMASPPIEGTLDGRLKVNGSLTALTGKLSLDGTSIAYPPATIGNLSTRLRWDNGTVYMDRLDVVNQTSTLTAKGRLDLLIPGSLHRVQDPSFELKAASDHLDPEAFIDFLKGDLTFNTSLTGTVGNPSGTLSLDGRSITAAGQAIDSLAVAARLEDRRLWLDRLLASVVPGQTIQASGWIGQDKTMDVRIASDDIAINAIEVLRNQLPLDGNIQLQAVAQGLIDNPDIQGQMTIADVIINKQPMDNMHLDFSMHDMRIEAAGRLDFDLEAVCDLNAGDFDLNLVFDNTETAAYFKAAGMPDLHGTLTGKVKAAGSLEDVLGTSAQVNISDLHLYSRKTALIETDRIELEMADRTLTIPEFEMALLSSGSLRLNGTAILDGDLDLNVDGRLPVAAIRVFVPDLTDATGMVTMAGNVSGTANAPLIDARIDLDTIGMTIPGLAQRLHDLSGRITLTADTVRIETLAGYLDTGSFSLSGTIDHDAFQPIGMDVFVDAKALPLEIPEELYVLLNSNIHITGNHKAAEATGELVVLEGVYYKDLRINLLQLASKRQRAVVPEPTPISVPYFDIVKLDIAVSHRQPFVVENNLAQLDISPDLKLEGTLAQPIVSGRAKVTEGSITFQNKTFTVTRGIIDFVNPYKTEAEIDILSQTKIRTWTITLSIKGTLDNLDLELTSVPSETDSDILSLILFGRTGRELAGGEGGSTRSTAQIMAEMLADTFGKDIKERTGVDILQVEENGAVGDDNATGFKVTVGKHLSNRMTVKYAVETKNGEIIQQAIAEYKLLENILVNGFQDTKGVYGSELVFRIEFR